MWHGRRVSLVFPTYNERESIRGAVVDFLETGLVDEVVVVNNNAVQGTSEEIAGTGAMEVFESRQGYGFALQRGIDSSSGDLIVLAEPDGTFSGRDLHKLLAYSDDMPVVLGTRTTREFIWDGANMGFLLKWGNWIVGKLTELLFNTTTLTDMGCTLRLLNRDVVELIGSRLTVGGSHFGAQLLLEVIIHGVPFVEIPVNYQRRVGRSSVTGSVWKAIALGLTMITLILRYRFGLSGRPVRRWDKQLIMAESRRH